MDRRDFPVRGVRLGVDIGQRQDFTALVVTENQNRNGIDHYIVRKIERMPLGTKYPAVANRVVQAFTNLQARAAAVSYIEDPYPVECWIDATGVGLPVLDLVREKGVPAKAAILTGTETITERADNVISIGKGYMVSRLAVLLEAGRLHLPINAEATALISEMKAYNRKPNARGHMSYNAESGKHDDLVIALALSVGESKRQNTSWSASWMPEVDDYERPPW